MNTKLGINSKQAAIEKQREKRGPKRYEIIIN